MVMHSHRRSRFGIAEQLVHFTQDCPVSGNRPTSNVAAEQDACEKSIVASVDSWLEAVASCFPASVNDLPE
jgi:hypothetical protein